MVKYVTMKESGKFIQPLAIRYFPESSPGSIMAALEENSLRKESIKKEIREISGFPEKLVENTANIVSHLEIIFDKSIKPYDGGAVSFLNNWQSIFVKGKLYEELEEKHSNITIIVAEDRILGRFALNSEFLVIDYLPGNDKAKVVSCNRKETANNTLMRSLDGLYASQVAVINF